MPKTNLTYWNTLQEENAHHWKPIYGMNDLAEELTRAIDNGIR